MNEEIFRKKSMDKVNSPENLDDYIRVSNPGVWLLLISVIILLAGACIWGAFGHIDSIVPAFVHIEAGEAVCRITEEDIPSVQVGMTVKFADHEAVIIGIEEESGDGYLCTLSAPDAPADGFYEGRIVVRSVRPLSFILN